MSTMSDHVNAGARDIPEDAALPGLGAVLDPGVFRELVRPHLTKGTATIGHGVITYIRYKPGTNCLVAYEIEFGRADGERSSGLLYAKLYTANDYPIALRKAERGRWLETPHLPPVVPLPESCAILYVFPNDCLIDGLRAMADPKKIQRLLYEHHPEFPPSDWRISDHRMKITTVRFKPERRAVLRCDTRALHRRTGEKRPVSAYFRVYADGRGEAVYAIQRRLFGAGGDRITVPRPIAYVRERRLFAMTAVEGEPLLDRLLAGDRAAVIAAAAALSELHRRDDPDLPVRTIDSSLADALATAAALEHMEAGDVRQTDAIIAGLTSLGRHCGRGRLTFVHGDFYYGQVVSQRGRAAIIDFDRAHFGEAAADLGNFCAHLRIQGLTGFLPDHRELERDFLDAYRDLAGEKMPEAVWKFYLALGLFQLAIGPFRRLEQNWRQKTKAILDECQNALQS